MRELLVHISFFSTGLVKFSFSESKQIGRLYYVLVGLGYFCATIFGSKYLFIPNNRYDLELGKGGEKEGKKAKQ